MRYSERFRVSGAFALLADKGIAAARFVTEESSSILPGKLCVGASLDQNQRPRIAAIFGMMGLQQILAHKRQAKMVVEPPSKHGIPGRVGLDLSVLVTR